jgi:hypothetical protein
MFEVDSTADAGRCSSCTPERSGGAPARTGHGRYTYASGPADCARSLQAPAVSDQPTALARSRGEAVLDVTDHWRKVTRATWACSTASSIAGAAPTLVRRYRPRRSPSRHRPSTLCYSAEATTSRLWARATTRMRSGGWPAVARSSAFESTSTPSCWPSRTTPTIRTPSRC